MDTAGRSGEQDRLRGALVSIDAIATNATIATAITAAGAQILPGQTLRPARSCENSVTLRHQHGTPSGSSFASRPLVANSPLRWTSAS
jgi:hypothetical protein